LIGRAAGLRRIDTAKQLNFAMLRPTGLDGAWLYLPRIP
jgi:hypothetical protein